MRITSKLISALLMVAIAAPVMASTKALAAKTVMEKAYATAKRDKKNVLVIFHASWCGWCKKMDAMLESPDFKATFENSYVITHIDVQEHVADKMALMNEGGDEFMSQLGGAKAGLPFFAILSPDGVKLADSILPKTGNMGYPSEPSEVAGFKEILTKTALKMQPTDITKIEDFLKSKAPATRPAGSGKR